MNIIREFDMEPRTRHYLFFRYVGEDGAGFSFPCNSEGLVDTRKLSSAAKVNYAQCLTGRVDSKPVERGTVEDERYLYETPGLGVCECGEEVELRNKTNECSCGREYTRAGNMVSWHGYAV